MKCSSINLIPENFKMKPSSDIPSPSNAKLFKQEEMAQFERKFISTEEFWAASKPLTVTMAMFGQFVDIFHENSDNQSQENNESVFVVDSRKDGSSETLKKNLKSEKCGGKFVRIYSIAVSVLLWLNSLRWLCYFRNSDKLGLEMFWKLAGLTWCFSAALNQLSLLLATFTNNKLKEATSCFIQHPDCLKSISVVSKRISITTWLIMLSYVILDSFILFQSETFSQFGNFLPLAVRNENLELAFNVVVFVLNIFTASSVAFPLALFLHLSLLFSAEVNRFNKSFSECLNINERNQKSQIVQESLVEGEHRETKLRKIFCKSETVDQVDDSREFRMISEEDVDNLLRRHKVLESSVTKLDSFACWCLGFNSVSHSALVVIMLFVAVWNSKGN